MLEVIREQGNIVAVCEWYLVDKSGALDSKGEYVWLAQIEISGSHKNNGVIGFGRQFYKGIIEKAPTAKCAYFQRRDKQNNKVRLYGKGVWSKIFREDKK